MSISRLTPEGLYHALFRQSYADPALDAAQERGLNILTSFSRKRILGRVNTAITHAVDRWFKSLSNAELLDMTRIVAVSREHNGDLKNNIYRWIYDEVIRRGELCNEKWSYAYDASLSKADPYDRYDKCWVIVDRYSYFLQRLISVVDAPVDLVYELPGGRTQRRGYASLLTACQGYLRACQKDGNVVATIQPHSQSRDLVHQYVPMTLDGGRAMFLIWHPTLQERDVQDSQALKAFFEREDVL